VTRGRGSSGEVRQPAYFATAKRCEAKGKAGGEAVTAGADFFYIYFSFLKKLRNEHEKLISKYSSFKLRHSGWCDP
jgi:hypothetical protein